MNAPATKRDSEIISVGELLRRLRVANFDAAARSRRHLESTYGPVTCKPECSYCCYAKILAPSYVGAFIYLHLRRMDAWTPELRARLAESDRLMTVRSHAGWLMGRRPCPFLKERSFGRGTCTIYPVRPEACALTHSVAPGDGSACADLGGKNLVSAFDDATALGYLPLVASIQKLVPPIVTTLPASVLVAEAVLEGLPMPDVVQISIDEGMDQQETIEQKWDRMFATVPDGE